MTHSPDLGVGTISPVGSRHATLARTRLVVVIHDMSARVTSDPSQPEHPYAWAGLSSSEAEVAVILDEAIVVAGTGRESQSPVLLVLAEAEQRGES
jgi:hypothetical protein